MIDLHFLFGVFEDDFDSLVMSWDTTDVGNIYFPDNFGFEKMDHEDFLLINGQVVLERLFCLIILNVEGVYKL